MKQLKQVCFFWRLTTTLLAHSWVSRSVLGNKLLLVVSVSTTGSDEPCISIIIFLLLFAGHSAAFVRPPAGDANKRVASSAARGRSYGIGFNGYQQPHGGPPGLPDRAPGLPARPQLATQAGAQLQACRTQSKCHTKNQFCRLKEKFSSIIQRNFNPGRISGKF